MALSFGIPGNGAFLFHRFHSAVGVRRRETTSRRSELEGLGNGHTSSRTQFLQHV